MSSGVGQLNDGAGQLSSGAGKLANSIAKITVGLNQANNGSNTRSRVTYRAYNTQLLRTHSIFQKNLSRMKCSKNQLTFT